LPPRQVLHTGNDPYLWHDDLPVVRVPIFLPQGC
jgi:hypothetical protein